LSSQKLKYKWPLWLTLLPSLRDIILSLLINILTNIPQKPKTACMY